MFWGSCRLETGERGKYYRNPFISGFDGWQVREAQGLTGGFRNT